ncbi:MAG: GntR family transcriptional regulator [Clostridium fessum]
MNVIGEKLQTEGEMAKSFGVSIITVRKAVSELVEKGLVRKKQGKGTFVCQRKVTKDMKKLQSFSEMCAHMGMKAGGRMLENRLEPASEKIARLLNVEKGS